jgi:ubiquinone/menaquinone biosynthesis C-methylase UbiE
MEDMDIKELKKNWNEFGEIDPLWAILTVPDKKGNKWRREEFFQSGVSEIGAVMQYIESLGASMPRRRALDFGCGVGRLTQALARYFSHVDGIDIAPSMIALAREYNQHGDRCTYHLNEAPDLKLFADNSFDFIYSNITLQHMEPQYAKKYIKEFIRLLTPQGILLFQQPSALKVALPALVKVKIKIMMVANKIIRFADPTMECYGIKQEEVMNFLKMNGAKIVDIVQDHCTPGWISFRYCVAKS